MTGVLAQVGQAAGGPDNPPSSCFQGNADSALPTCTYQDGHWTRSYDTGPSSGGGAGIGVAFAFVLVLGIVAAVWRVRTLRRVAREAGLSEAEARALTMVADDGFTAGYLTSRLTSRPVVAPVAPAPPVTPVTPVVAETVPAADRLRELKGLAQQELITPEEYELRRRAVIDGI